MILSLGLDLSLTAPGLVLLLKEKGVKDVIPVIAEQIPVPTSDKATHWQRVSGIGDHVASVIETHDPGIIVIEGYGQGGHKNVSAFVKQVDVGAIVRLILWGNDKQWQEVPPTSLKQFVTGKGKLPPGAKGKKEMIRHVSERWGFQTKNHNIADAYGLARWGLARAGAIPCTPEQSDVMDRVKSGA